MSIDAQETKDTKNNFYVWSAVISELLFVLVPFLVLSLVFAYQDKGVVTFLSTPEWAFASALLFGQTIVKIVTATLETSGGRSEPIVERVGLVVSGLIVLGPIPSMVILALILIAGTPPIWLIITQIALFILSVAAFILIGGSSLHDIAEYKMLVQTKRNHPR
jgi:hypothetical protein